MNNDSPRPIYTLPQNAQWIRKSSEVKAGREDRTDYKQTEFTPTVGGPSTRIPTGRNLGNVFCRRNLDGSLDLDYAVGKVVDALHVLKQTGALSPEECVLVGTLFPEVLAIHDALAAHGMLPAQALLQSGLGLYEVGLVRQGVAEHFAKEVEYRRYR